MRRFLVWSSISLSVACASEGASPTDEEAPSETTYCRDTPLSLERAADGTLDLKNEFLSCVDLGGADRSGADLTHAVLEKANLANADLSNADLTDAWLVGADLTGANLAGARLDGATTAGIVGCPATLPDRWQCIALSAGDHMLVGPGARFEGVELEGVDLGEADLSGTKTGRVASCPAVLPESWICTAQGRSAFLLAGPGADLRGEALYGVDLLGADLTGALASGLLSCPASLPESWYCIQSNPPVEFDSVAHYLLLGPGADLSEAALPQSLRGLDLTGVDLRQEFPLPMAMDLKGCPAFLPEEWACVEQSDGLWALVGPGAWLGLARLGGAELARLNLAGALLDGADLSRANLAGANLLNASFIGANLSDTNLDGAELGGDMQDANLTGANFSGATLVVACDNAASSRCFGGEFSFQGVRASRLPTCPDRLPSGWECVHDAEDTFMLAGPGANLTDAEVSVPLPPGSRFLELRGCPARLPSGWGCVPLGDRFAILGPGVDLSDLQLAEADLAGVDLTGANLSRFRAQELLACPAALPSPWVCVTASTGRATLLSEGASLLSPNLDGADLSGLDLTGISMPGVNLTDANLTDTNLTDANLEGAKVEGADFTGAKVSGLRAFNLNACPPHLDARYRCVDTHYFEISAVAVAGPGVDLSLIHLEGTALAGVDLTGANLEGAFLDGADLNDVIWSNTTCPDGASSDADGTCEGHLTP